MKKNFLIITSIIEPPNTAFTYCKKRSVFTHEERYTQTKKTIIEARKKIPDLTIMLIEASELTNEEEEFFKQNTDYFFNLINTNLISSVYSKYKAKGEFTQVLFGISKFQELCNIKEYSNMFKQCGRYYFSDEFDYKQYNNDKVVVKQINNNINNIYTSAYKIPTRILNTYSQFIQMNNVLLTKDGAEPFFAKFIKTLDSNEIIFVNKIYNNGYVSVTGEFHSG